VIQAGAFASRFSGRIEERNMFYLAPLLLLAFVVWLAKGSPRPSAAAAITVLVPTALTVTIPIETLLNVSITSDTFAFIPLLRLSGKLNGGVTEVRALLGLGALTAGLLFLLLPHRAARLVLPAAVALFLIISSRSVFGMTEAQALAARNEPGVSDPSWVDHRLGRRARAAFLFTSDFSADPHPVWQTEFWNRSVGSVYNFGGSDPTGLPSVATTFDPATGRISPTPATGSQSRLPRYVVVDAKTHLDGRLLEQQGRLALYRVDKPLRLADSMAGVYPDGWMGAIATYDRFTSSRQGRPRAIVVLSRAGIAGPAPARARITVGALRIVAGSASMGRIWSRQVGVVRDGSSRRFSLPARRSPYRVEVHLAPTFSPSQFGSAADTRQLGARVTFTAG
jgi:hypothetical protein